MTPTAPSKACIVIADDDPSITESLALVLDRGDATVVLCGDVVAAELAVEQLGVTHVVADVQFSGEFGFEGLQFVARARKRNPACRVVMMSGHTSPALRDAALGAGADAFLSKPFNLDELELALELPTTDPALEPAPAADRSSVLRIPPIDECIADVQLSADFQPILRLGRSSEETSVYGYEALARYRGPWPFAGAGALFDYAERSDRLAELDLACVARALDGARELPGHGAIFVNVDPVAFRDARIIHDIRRAIEHSGIDTARLVLEVTERTAFADDFRATQIFDELRALGIRFALDDVGSAYSHLGMIERIAPSFMKISQSFGTGFESDPTRQRIVRHVVALAADFGCEVVIEGVEAPATAAAARELGIGLAQGYLFGRAAPAREWRRSAA